MSVKIIITRQVPKEQVAAVLPLLLKIRALAIAQPGYVSAETLVNVQRPEEHLVISTWKSIEDWERWTRDPERNRLQARIEELLGATTHFSVYYNG